MFGLDGESVAQDLLPVVEEQEIAGALWKSFAYFGLLVTSPVEDKHS